MQKLLVRFICCFIPNRHLRSFMRRIKFGRYKITGKNNIIEFCGHKLPRYFKIVGVDIHISGNNNRVVLGRPMRIFHANITISNDESNIVIGDSAWLGGLDIRCAFGRAQNILIGTHFTAHGVNILCDDMSSISIGNDVLMSNDINIWCSDGHAIIDNTSKSVINLTHEPLTIGDHCWIGQGARLLKNARIPSNSIVGGGSVVGKRFEEEYTVIAGNPARVIRQNVSWDKNLPWVKHMQQLQGEINNVG